MDGPRNSAHDTLLLLLSLAAGCVDARAFVSVGVFTANMTGNSVVLALALLHPDVDHVALPFLALAAFCLGVAVGARLTVTTEHTWSRGVSRAMFLAGVVMLVVATLISVTGEQLLVATGFAMGVQSAAVQRLGVAGVATVVVTGTLTTAITRFVAPGPGERRAGAWLPALTWIGYLAGAILGGLQTARALILFLPGALLLAVAAIAQLGRATSAESASRRQPAA
ncbi:MAG: hypothetical protein JWO36_2497 [Myxococcales bacterium]|nr:hypothetical protein [Myxococcales bacterium]